MRKVLMLLITVGAEARPVVADSVVAAPLVARPPLAEVAHPALLADAVAGLALAVCAAVAVATLCTSRETRRIRVTCGVSREIRDGRIFLHCGLIQIFKLPNGLSPFRKAIGKSVPDPLFFPTMQWPPSKPLAGMGTGG